MNFVTGLWDSDYSFSILCLVEIEKMYIHFNIMPKLAIGFYFAAVFIPLQILQICVCFVVDRPLILPRSLLQCCTCYILSARVDIIQQLFSNLPVYISVIYYLNVYSYLCMYISWKNVIKIHSYTTLFWLSCPLVTTYPLSLIPKDQFGVALKLWKYKWHGHGKNGWFSDSLWSRPSPHVVRVSCHLKWC